LHYNTKSITRYILYANPVLYSLSKIFY